MCIQHACAETGSRGKSLGCTQPRLDKSPKGGGLGVGGGGGGVERGRSMPPPVEPCGQSSEQSTATKSHTGSCNTSIEEPASL